jgi:hypothetical protein
VIRAVLSSTNHCSIFFLNIPYLVTTPEMTSDVDRKTYWDLLETLRWICNGQPFKIDEVSAQIAKCGRSLYRFKKCPSAVPSIATSAGAGSA